MKKAIVITSIYAPTKGVVLFSKMNGHQLIVVGDAKTPRNWHRKNVAYLPLNEQEKKGFCLGKTLPQNHYCRKMIGYLYAISQGAELIVDADDDIMPKKGWHYPPFCGKYDRVAPGKGFINVYDLFSNQKIWPRGLPLHLIKKKINHSDLLARKKVEVGIWQGLTDKDPDVDAIYRLILDAPCVFKKRKPIILDENTMAPFNSQNTIIRKELFPLLYLPTTVTFRFTDILRGLVAQPIMWLYGYRLGFLEATTTTKRNPHDYFKDFVSEIPMYQHSASIIDIVQGAVSKDRTMGNNLYRAYAALKSKKIVGENELVVLKRWLKDLEKMQRS